MLLCNATRQVYVRVHIPLHNCCVHLLAREKRTKSNFDLLSEVIFKDLAVTVKLRLGNWFVLAVATFSSGWDH